ESGNAQLGDGKMALYSADGGNNENTLKALKAGDEITIRVIDEDNLGLEDVEQAITGFTYYLVQNGKINPSLYTRSDWKDTHPRTTIGIKADGTIVIHEVDGRQAGFSDGLSDIATAEYMLTQDCVTAIRLDGGGSSTAIARLPGDSDITVLNSPSDGAQRKDSNGILLLAKKEAANDGAKMIHAYPGTIQILEGSTYDLSNLTVKATDSNYWPSDLTASLSYSADSNIGETNGSLFTAKKGSGSVSGQITITAGEMSASVKVEVVNRVDELRPSAPLISVTPGSSYGLQVDALLANRRIISSPDAFDWNLSSDALGQIDSTGNFTAGLDVLAGTLTVSGGERTLPVAVEVGTTPVVTSGTEWKYLDTGVDANTFATFTNPGIGAGLPNITSAWAYPAGSAVRFGVGTADAGLRIRATAPSGTQVGSIPLNGVATLTRVSAKHGTTTWVELDYNGVRGWSSSDYLKIADISGANDSEWKNAAGPFGVSEDGGAYHDSTTTLHQSSAGEASIPTYFFRTTFQVENASDIRYIVGDLVYNDAAIIYINGVKVGSLNTLNYANNLSYGAASLPDGVKAGTFAVTDTSMLTDGTNTLAVEIHQRSAESKDAYFNFRSLILSKQQPLANPEINSLTMQPGADETRKNFTWYSASPNTGYVQIALKALMTNGVFPADNALTFDADASAVPAANGYFTNHVTVTGIEPGTEYVYRVGNGELWSGVQEMKTESVEAFTFLFAGDPQIGSSGNVPQDVKGWSRTVGRAIDSFPETDFIVSAGDQVENNNNETQYAGFLSPEELPALPLAPTIGNHDLNVAFQHHFNVPNHNSALGNTSANAGGDYSYVYGNTLFMVLNSNNSGIAEHKEFMTESIEANPDVDWKIVTFHHAIYSTASHTNDDDIVYRRTNWVGAFDELGIDVVLNGHDHVYDRSYQMLGGTPQINQVVNEQGQVVDPTGIVYIAANSASGSKYYAIKAGNYDFKALDMQLSTPTISKIDITADTFSINTYRVDTMTVVDTYSLLKTDATFTQPLTTAIRNAQAVDLELFTPESAAVYVAAINAAVATLTADITQEESQSALLALQTAAGQLKYKVNKTALNAALAKADEAIASGEIDKALPICANAFQTAYAAALALAAEPGATQEGVNEAVSALVEALGNLIPAPDKAPLVALKGKALDLNQDVFTPASYAALLVALAEADAVLENSDAYPDEVEDAYRNLYEAIAKLIVKPANKSALNNAIAQANAIDPAKYYPAPNFAQILEDAKAVQADATATQTRVDGAVLDLTQALSSLRIIPNKVQLRMLIQTAEQINTALYTTDSAQVLQTALDHAHMVIDAETDQTQVDASYKALNDALAQLIPLRNTTPVPGGGGNLTSNAPTVGTGLRSAADALNGAINAITSLDGEAPAPGSNVSGDDESAVNIAETPTPLGANGDKSDPSVAAGAEQTEAENNVLLIVGLIAIAGLMTLLLLAWIIDRRKKESYKQQ
ncbi:MAG: phosphodiester glycosidase family protein, partial [Clostridiales Family XIII bacterium]|nr:phosphodiester glycosidase family protein [Clostridiales Family XIII bacterium]